MGFGLLIAGFILLSNPVIMLPIFGDILPDAVGFFLIAAGLTKLSAFIGKISEARDGFIKLAFTEVAKFVAMLALVMMSGSAKPLLALVFGVLEAMFFIPAVLNLFEGLSFAGLWYGGTAVYAKRTVARKVRKAVVRDGKKTFETVEKTREIEQLAVVRRTMIFFYLLRIVSTLVPELAELQLYDYLGTVDRMALDFVRFKPLFYILFAILVIAFGIVFIVRTARFFGALRGDRPFIAALEDKYNRDILPRTTYFIAKRMKLVLAFFALSAAASFILPIDNVNVLVGAVSSGLLITAGVLMLKYERSAVWSVILAAARCVLSVLNTIGQIRYFNDYSADAVLRVSDAYSRYYGLAMREVLEYVLALASVLFFFVSLMKAVKAHLEICGIQTDNAMYSKRNRDLEIYNAVGGRLLLASILAILNYVISCSYRYLAVDLSLVLVLTTAVTIVYAAYAVYAMHTIDDQLYDKEIEMF